MNKYLLLIIFLTAGFFLLLLSPAKANAGCCTAVDCGADNTCSGPVFDDSGACITQGTCQYAGGNDCGYCNGSWCQGWSVVAGQSCGSASTGCGGCGGGGGIPPTPTPTNTPTPTPTPLTTLPARGTTTPITCGSTCYKDGWKGPISLSVLPGSGDIEAEADFAYKTTETYPGVTPATYKQYLRQTVTRGGESYVRNVPLDQYGSPQWGSSTTWAGPYGIPSFCNGNHLQSADYKLYEKNPPEEDTLKKAIWCRDIGFECSATVDSNGVEGTQCNNTNLLNSNWNQVETLSNLPGSGVYQTQADYIIDGTISQNIWRGNKGYERRKPSGGQYTAWSEVENLVADPNSLSGSGDMQVSQNTVVPNQTLFQSFWRGGQGWTRSLPIIDGNVRWSTPYDGVCENGNTCSGGACKLNACVDLPCACTAKTYTRVNYMNPQATPIPRNVCQASWGCGTATGAYSSCEYASSYFSENTSADNYTCSGAYTYGLSDLIQVTPVPTSGYQTADVIESITSGKFRGWPKWTGLQTLNIVLTLPTPTLTPTPGSPAISNLQIGNVRPTGTSAYRIVGNQSGQGGANWYNPMNITVNVARGTSWSGTPTPVSAAYVALYDDALTKVTAKASLVSTVQNYLKVSANTANAKKGLLLGYGTNIVAGQSGHFVWDPTLNSGNGGWANIPAGGYTICQDRTNSTTCDATILYTVEPSGNFSWQVTFDKKFGSKNLYTAVYAKDSNDKDAFDADITPVNP